MKLKSFMQQAFMSLLILQAPPPPLARSPSPVAHGGGFGELRYKEEPLLTRPRKKSAGHSEQGSRSDGKRPKNARVIDV